MKRLAVLFGLALFLLMSTSVSAAECEFVLGFKTLRDLIGHGIVGECLENQHHGANGDALQQTTGGLLAWRKADNWTAFTDGYRTWINGPNGLVQRLNTERFAWEADYAPGGAVATPIPIATPPPTATPDATAMHVQTIQNLRWVRDGLTPMEIRAVSSLQQLAVTAPDVLRTLLNSQWSWMPPRNEVELSTLEHLVAMSAADEAGVQRLIRSSFLFNIERADLEVIESLRSELALNPNVIYRTLSHPALGKPTARNLAVVVSLLSLKRNDPEAAAAIEALPWVRDGIRSPFPLDRGYEFELNRVSDLLDWAHNAPQTFANLINKPRILNDFNPFPRTKAVRGVAGDLWADVTIGQPDFSQVSEVQVVPFKVFNPGGVVVDSSVSPGRMYVWDAGNSRILGIDLSTCYEGSGPCSADIVIGQPSAFDHSACNGDSNLQGYPVRAGASAETLCGISDLAISVNAEHTFVTMAVDAQGNLYVPDSLNNRVLKHERPFETDAIADEVWGQRDFSGMNCNRGRSGHRASQDSLCFHSDPFRLRLGWFASGVDIDFTGSLWVADAANHRVLRFPLNERTGAIAKQADLVLGQRGFTGNAKGAALNRLDSPAAVRTDTNGHVYVADKGNNRVLVYTPPLKSGMSATFVLHANLNRPTSLELDPATNGVWINNSEDNSLVYWHLGGRRERVTDRNIQGASGGGIGIDGEGSILLPLHSYLQDVYRFPVHNLGPNARGIAEPDKRLFSPPGGINFKGDRELRNGTGVVVHQDQLIVADTKRLMFWNGVASLRNGEAADGIVGETNWSSSAERCCGQTKVDKAGRLWVLGTDVTRYIEVFQLPLTTDSLPLKTIVAEGASFPVLGSDRQVTLGPYIRGLAPVGNGEALWISDSHNHRVLRLRDPLGEPVVDVILGQKEAAGTKCNRHGRADPWGRPERVAGGPTAEMLCFPGALSIDRLGNLYVSDHSLPVAGNWRLLVFAASLTPEGNHSPIFAPAATKVFSRLGAVQSRYFPPNWLPTREIKMRGLRRNEAVATWEPAFDSTNCMVVGFNSYFGPRYVAFFDDPLGSGTTPSGFLHDFGSMPYAATFDEDDNLYVADLNRNRVLIYWKPFSK